MLRNRVAPLGLVLVASPLAAQENPFALTGGSVKSAYITYDLTTKAKQGAPSSWELGVAPDRMIIRMVLPYDAAGKKDTLRTLLVTTRDSQYTYTRMASQPGADGEVSPLLRPYLAREYAALDAAGKARFRQNVKLMAKSESGSNSDMDALISLTGEKTGSETIGGHKCDVYKRGEVTACVVPNAPMVMLRWSNPRDGVSMTAKKVTLNGAIPPTASVLPKGVKWRKKPYDDADFILGVWAMKKQSDPETAPAAQLAKFGVSYLASAAATNEIREMSGGGDETTEEDNPAGDDSADAEGGS
jgi:hypothetical protein